MEPLADLDDVRMLLGALEASTGGGAFLWDTPDRFVPSPGFARLFGMPMDRVWTEQEVFAQIHGDDLPQLAEVVRLAPVQGAALVVRFRVRNADGWRWVEARLQSSPSTRGTHRIVGTTFDVTEAHEANLNLRRASELLEATQRAARVGSFSVDLETGEMNWSAELYRVMDVPLGVPITAPLALADCTADDEARARAWFDQLRAGQDPPPVVLHARRADGSPRVLEVRGRIDTNQRGHATLYGLAIDMSRTHALEEELRRAAKLEAVGTLAAGVAHDFNNYLTVLSIHLDLLDAQVSPSLASAIARMRRAVDQSASLTAQLLTFARRAPSEAERLELTEQVTAFVELFRHVVGPEVQFTHRIPAGPMAVRLDPGQLESALANLVTNARDATPAGGWIGVLLDEATLAPGDPRLDGLAPGRFARISVSDSGHGIPAADLGRIFEPYFTTKEQRGGTGLGLASVYGFVRQAGGRIEVQSTVGEGTTFHLYFRLVQAPDSRPPAPAEALPVARRSRVLVVEDVDDVREVARDLLLAERCEVFLARDGVEALALVARERPSVVLTDLRMPRMDGHALIARLQAEFPDIRLVAMTGYAEAGPVPGVPVLYKPFDRRALRLALALGEGP